MLRTLHFLRHHLAVLVAILLLTGGTAAFGLVQADRQERAFPSKLSACVNLKTLVMTRAYAGMSCPKGSKKISWNVRGRTGAAGPTGLAGPAGSPGSPGPVGPSGAPGADGEPGAVGASGAVGPVGPAGSPGPVGPAGAPGPVGPAGAPGPVGPAGAPGADGEPGADGAPGAIGPVGPAGAAGPAGATGPAGAAFEGRYAYISNTSDQVVAIEADIIFDTNGILNGFTHGPATTQLVVSQTGVYAVRFSVTSFEPNQVAVFVNGTDASGSFGSGSGGQQNNGEVLLELSAGDVLTLRNHTSVAAFTLQTVAGGTQTNVNAWLLVERLAAPPL